MTGTLVPNAGGKVIVRAFQEWASSRQKDWNATQSTNFAHLSDFLTMINDYGPHTELAKRLSERLMSLEQPAFSEEFKEEIDKLISQPSDDPGLALLGELKVSGDAVMQYLLWTRSRWEIKSA
jgi:hypothetical protein